MKAILIIILVSVSGCSSSNWRTASRESVGIAPKASELKEDIVQVYYARAFSWRGTFGVHPWIAWKEVKDKQYTVAQVTSWNIRRQGTSVHIDQDLPDRRWFDKMPHLLFEARGKHATIIIKKLKQTIPKYPFADEYGLWPGPNSNTFVAFLLREIDELDIELPPHAIGKDYLGKSTFISNTASNTGFTFSILGALGLTLGVAEGVELNLFGLHFGLDFWTPAIKLPFIGRLGFDDRSLKSADSKDDSD